jgi:hypothetical protein
MKPYNQMGNREEIPAHYRWDTEGASLEIRRSQAKLSGKRTLLLKLSGKFPLQSDIARDTDGESSSTVGFDTSFDFTTFRSGLLNPPLRANLSGS